MTAKFIISYDDTDNDRDALALGRLLAGTDASVALAYVEHREDDSRRAEALEMLARGAAAIGQPDADRHVVVSGSTGEGLGALVEREQADVVVFGSDYRTPAGSVRPGTSAERLLEGGPAAIAIAPAGLRDATGELRRVGLLADDAGAANATAFALARALDGEVVAPSEGPVDLLVVGSRPEAPSGRVGLSAAASYAIETARSPVLVVRRDIAVPFAARTSSDVRA